MIKNRVDAGKKIARALAKYKGKDAVVYAIPRGGVIVGREIANELHLPLDLVVTRKLVKPGNVNLAFGAVDEAGDRMIDEAVLAEIDPVQAEEEIFRQSEEVTRRAQLYRAGKTPVVSTGKIAIIVDDGITTGYNIRPAVEYIHKQQPKKIVVAIPVAPRHSLEDVRKMADEIVTLISPETFGTSVDEHFVDFAQPSDREVINALQGVTSLPKTSNPHRGSEEEFFSS